MCPFGDDPETYHDLPERQVVKCTSAATGKYTLSFRGKRVSFLADMTEEEWETAFNSVLPTYSSVVVQFVYFNGSDAKRVAAGGVGCYDRQGEPPVAYIVVDFAGVHGNVPAIEVVSIVPLQGSRPGMTIYHRETVEHDLAAYDGTTEKLECSNRGHCDRKRGTCRCFENFFPSDGQGG